MISKGTQITIRNAAEEDAPALAAFARMAGHGLMDIFYEGLLPGHTVEQAILARRIAMPGSFCHWNRWKVATTSNGEVLGGLNCFPHAVFDISPSDPLLHGWRMELTTNLWELEKQASGTFYLNMIAVNPRTRGKGIGNILIEECLWMARASGFSRVTLSTYEEDASLMAFYGRHYFSIVGRAAIPAHPALKHTGHWALLARNLDRPGL